MRRILLFLLLLCFFANAKMQNVQILAKNVRQENNTVYATGDVLLYSEIYLITADNATYNTLTKDIELFGNINMLRGSDEMSRSDKMTLNLEKDLGDFSQFFFFNQESDLWIRCGNASLSPEYYIANKAIMSSCDVENPDWKIGFSKGELNRESKFLHIYNALFYIKDVPILYMPYFAFPTDKTRRTGLLRPEIAYTKDEGFIYAQPFYFAPYESWDLEVVPQIRTERGNGFQTTFRFADSPYSRGHFAAGGFREKDTYTKIEDLKNKYHYGYDFFYDRKSLVSKFFGNETEDGLLIDFKYLNDVDYMSLKSANTSVYDKLATSRLNYFLRNEKHYAGVYGKYFIDMSADNNDRTLQELPTVQYHKFLDSLFVNNLRYSADAQYHNYYRKTGLKAQQFEVNIPATFYFSLFEGALRGSVSENIYLMRVNYDGFDAVPENYGEYMRNYHALSLYTDLAKAYEGFYHKMYFGIDHIIPSFDKQKGYLDRDEFVPINTAEKQITLNFKQYLFDKNGAKRVTHSIRQPYYFENDRYVYAPLENRVEWEISARASLANEMWYSHDLSKIVKSLTYATYRDENRRAYFSHVYNKDEGNDYLSLNFENKIFKNSSIFGEIQYDIEDSLTKSWSVGFGQRKSCWDYRIFYREDTTPKLTSIGRTDSIDRRGIYLMFNLYPIGGMDYEYSVESTRDL